MAHTTQHDHTPHAHDSVDAWHTHGPGEPVPQQPHREMVNAGAVAFIGFGGFVLLVAVIVIVIAYYQLYVGNRILERRVAGVGGASIQVEYLTQREAAMAQLGGYDWVDPEAGVVSRPLESAKQAVIEAYSNRR